MADKVQVGEIWLVYNALAMAKSIRTGNHDNGYKKAKILQVREAPWSEQMADVEFIEDGRLSYSHFTQYMLPVPEDA